MNGYEKSIELGLTGTDAEKVAKLKAITAQPIRLDYLLELLNFRGMLRKTDGSGGQERWQGTLQNLKSALVAMSMTAEVAAYEMWFSHVTNPRQVTWDTRIPAWATAFLAMETAFAGQSGMPSQADFDTVVALGGGRPFASLTTSIFAAQRTSAQEAAALVPIDQAYNTVLNEIVNSELSSPTRTKASIAAKLREAAAALEA